MSGRSERGYEALLRAGAQARVARTRAACLRERVLDRIEACERPTHVPVVRERSTRSWLAAAAAAILVASLFAYFARDRGPAGEIVRDAASNPARPRWQRVLAEGGDPALALQREAESLRDDTQRLLRRLAQNVRLGPASGRG